MTVERDPMEEAAARIRAAGDQFGAALSSAINLAFRRTCASTAEKEFGPGPWLLFSDGRMKQVPPDVRVEGEDD